MMNDSVLRILSGSSTEPDRFVKAAVHYASLGYRVFPVVPGDKVPFAESHGHLDATTDLGQIQAWWNTNPAANIGIRTDGLVVVDVDGPTNPWLLNDLSAFQSLLACPTQLTPHEGRHSVFRQPTGKGWRKTESQLAPNVDTRANDSYIVVAPSALSDGRLYRWAPDHILNCPPNDLPEPPPWLAEKLDALESQRAKRSSNEHLGSDSDPIPLHTRNSTLTSIAGSLRRIGLSADAIDGALQRINADRCKPPLSSSDVSGIAKSVARYEPDQISTALAEGAIFTAFSGERLEQDPIHPGSFPQKALTVPGLMGEIIEHNLATAHIRQPVLALSGSLALMSAITGRKIQDEKRTQTNLYIMGLCPAGEGKEHSRWLNKEFLQRAGWQKIIGPESFASAAGIVSTIEVQPVTLFQLDEIGRLLKTVHDPRRSPHLYNIVSVLLKLYTTSGKLYIGDAYADVKKTKRIEWPHACIYGTTVPTNFYEALTTEDLQEGFSARVLVFEVEEEGQDNLDSQPDDPPESIIRQIEEWRDFAPGGNLACVHPQPVTVPYAAPAKALLQEFRAHCQDEKRKADGSVRSLWTRCTENAQKCAVLYAASEQGTAIREVSHEAVAWAISLIEYLTKKLIYSAMTLVGGTELELVTKNMLNKFREAGRKGLRRTDLCWLFKGHSRQRREDMLQTLLDAGQVIPVIRSPNGRKVTVYLYHEFVTPDDLRAS